MRTSGNSGHVHRMLVLGGALLLVSACATVNPDEMQEELDRIRAEMREGNEQVEARMGERIDQLEQRMDSRISSLENDMSTLRDELGASMERLESAVRFNTPIHFAFDEAEIKDEARPLLDRFAEVIGSHYADAVITVEGFTDAAGSTEYNRRLGMQRAEAVMAYLASAGVSENRLRAVSYGQARERQVVPDAQGPGEDGWENRRVALVVDFNPAR
jgi:peptidoglycan-associated lipoprotein